MQCSVLGELYGRERLSTLNSCGSCRMRTALHTFRGRQPIKRTRRLDYYGRRQVTSSLKISLTIFPREFSIEEPARNSTHGSRERKTAKRAVWIFHTVAQNVSKLTHTASIRSGPFSPPFLQAILRRSDRYLSTR